ncbi:MAG TPA: hypothetical protein VK835_11120 [Bacteroidia bacterium]|jgi:hypothetical protein|nr:hypothetical protein [Bacteroidia bacterium]
MIEYTKPIIEKASPIKKIGSTFLSVFLSLVDVLFNIAFNSCIHKFTAIL